MYIHILLESRISYPIGIKIMAPETYAATLTKW